MPAYRVVVHDKAYEGHYRSKSAAVFGAMLKEENEAYAEAWGPRHSSACTQFLPDGFQKNLCSCGRNAIVIGAMNRRHLLNASRSTILITPVTDRRVPKKIHRVA
jgi:hypothetical protein